MFSSSLPVKAVKKATIEFADSNKIFAWTESDGCLLDFAEANNLPAISSCRNGHCGACVVELLAGEIIYEHQISAALGGNEILLCSAKPATQHIILKL